MQMIPLNGRKKNKRGFWMRVKKRVKTVWEIQYLKNPNTRFSPIGLWQIEMAWKL